MGTSSAATLLIELHATDDALVSYSRSRGLFAGVSLEGSTLRPDDDDNKKLYGKEIKAKEIVIDSTVRPPASAELLLSTLNKKSPKHKSAKKGEEG